MCAAVSSNICVKCGVVSHREHLRLLLDTQASNFKVKAVTGKLQYGALKYLIARGVNVNVNGQNIDRCEDCKNHSFLQACDGLNCKARCCYDCLKLYVVYLFPVYMTPTCVVFSCGCGKCNHALCTQCKAGVATCLVCDNKVCFRATLDYGQLSMFFTGALSMLCI